MAVASPSAAARAPADAVTAVARPASGAGTRSGALLLLALLLSVLYACFAAGAASAPEEPRLQVALAVLALAAVAVWAGSGRPAPLPPRPARVGLGLLAALAAWSALSLLWTVAPTGTLQEVNRTLAYALVASLAVVAGARSPRAVERAALGWWAVALLVALYALGGKVLPGVHLGPVDLNHTESSARLRAPLEYWNALGLVCVLGIPVGLRLATSPARAVPWRLAGIASVLVFLVVQGMTYSRGGLLSLGVAAAVLLLLGAQRLRTLAVLLACLAASTPVLGLAFTLAGTTTNGAPLDQREHDGLVLLGGLLVVLAVLLGTAFVLLRLERRVPWSPERGRRTWRLLGTAAAALVLLSALSTAAAPGGVRAKVDGVVEGFTSSAQDRQFDPDRLASGNSGNRWQWWGEAVGSWRDAPVVGHGAGSFPVIHLQYRRDPVPVAQPHSVPLQFLTELGLVGLLLAAGAFAALGLAAVRRVRALPQGTERDLGVALLAGAAAWAVHGAFDWDWDIPGVTLPVLLFLGLLAGSARRDLELARPAGATRPVVFVDPDAPSREGPRRAAGVLLASLALCGVAALAALPSFADGLAADAQAAAGDERADDASLVRAAARAETAARLDPLAVRPLFAGAAIATRRGRGVEARELLLDAVRRQPENAEAWSRLATTAFLLADRDGFEQAALRALSLDPQSIVLRKLAARAISFAAPPGASATATGTPLAPAVP